MAHSITITRVRDTLVVRSPSVQVGVLFVLNATQRTLTLEPPPPQVVYGSRGQICMCVEGGGVKTSGPCELYFLFYFILLQFMR